MLRDIMKKTDKPLVLVFINKAIVSVKTILGTDNMNGICHTIDNYFCEWNGVMSYENRLMSKTIFIEEFSMVPNK